MPAGVTRPIALGGAPVTVNQMLPSGPSVISDGWPLLVKPDVLVFRNSLIVPSGPILPIPIGIPSSVNQTFPSGPLVIRARVRARTGSGTP